MTQKYSDTIDTMKKMMAFIDVRMNTIQDVSLEDEDYNDLYLALREARNAMLKATKAQHEIDKKQESQAFWEDMKAMRRPGDDIPKKK